MIHHHIINPSGTSASPQRSSSTSKLHASPRQRQTRRLRNSPSSVPRGNRGAGSPFWKMTTHQRSMTNMYTYCNQCNLCVCVSLDVDEFCCKWHQKGIHYPHHELQCIQVSCCLKKVENHLTLGTSSLALHRLWIKT